MEKPKIATAVIATLISVTLPVPNLLVSLSLIKLDIIVSKDMMNEIIPAYDTGTLKAG